jgi:response regulator NasT
VGLGASSEHALELIEQIVHEAACPVVALLHGPDPGFVIEAARRGVFAYITDGDPQEWQNSIEIVLRRFAEFHDLEAAFKRRAITERAKGILMERHALDEERAFRMLRDKARLRQTMLVDESQSIVDRDAACWNLACASTRSLEGGWPPARTMGRSNATACSAPGSR